MNGFRRAQLTITAVTNAAVIDGLVVIAQLNFFLKEWKWKKKSYRLIKQGVFFPLFLKPYSSLSKYGSVYYRLGTVFSII